MQFILPQILMFEQKLQNYPLLLFQVQIFILQTVSHALVLNYVIAAHVVFSYHPTFFSTPSGRSPSFKVRLSCSSKQSMQRRRQSMHVA